MKGLFIVFLILYIFASNVYAKENMEFQDIEQHWAKKEINLLIGESVIDGYEDGTFKPDNDITVSEFLKILIEMADYKLETSGEKWPNWYIETAIKKDLIKNDTFQDYSRNITRYEVAQIVSKYINITNVYLI